MLKVNETNDPETSPTQTMTELQLINEERSPSPSGSPSGGPSTARDEEEEPEDEVGQDIPRISQPERFDVLFGRGKPYQGHAGNIRLHKIVDLYKPRYSQARRHEKTEIAEEIVQFIKTAGANDNPGRFLKRVENEEAWIEVSDSVARDKVSHALRGKPRKESDTVSGMQVSGAGLEELLSAKRAASGTSPGKIIPLTGVNGGHTAKRQRLHHVSDLELFAARHGHGPFMGPGVSVVGNQQANIGPRNMLQHRHQQQLFASALAERQFAAGMASPYIGRMGLFAQPHPHSSMGAPFRHPMIPPGLSSGEVNPMLLQQIAAERQLRADPRYWM